MPQTRQSKIIWAHVHAIEETAMRLESEGRDAGELRRVYVAVGEEAMELDRLEELQ